MYNTKKSRAFYYSDSQLRISGKNGVKNSHQDEPYKRFEILLLHNGQGNWERIEQAIADQQWRYHSLASVSALQDSLRDGVKAVLIDASFLPEISAKLLLHYSQRQTPPSLLFVSDRCDIKIRIQAIQAGARKLFPEPVDLKVLIREIGNVIQQKTDFYFKVVVIAEDEENAKPTLDLLHQGAIETLLITKPLAIIDAVWRFRPDLILMLDPRFSDVDNIVLTKLIREREESLAIPIVFLSDDDNPEKKLQAMLAGADDFLLKPIQSQQLLTAVISRIERIKTIATAGAQMIDERPVELPDRKAHSNYLEVPKYPGAGAKGGTAWLREEFVHDLQNGSTTFRERSFTCPNMHTSVAETIELIPQHNLKSLPADLYQEATLCGAAIELDRFIFEYGMQRLYDYTHLGKPVRLIVRQTIAVLEDPDYIEFIKTVLRRYHIVGNGLLLEFSLPSIASCLSRTIALFDELAALGIGVSLSHFLCNDVGYKALLNLKADVVRPRFTYLQAKAELADIESVARNIHSQQAEMILPYIEQTEEVSPKWYQYADYIQADLIQEKLLQEEMVSESLKTVVYQSEGSAGRPC